MRIAFTLTVLSKIVADDILHFLARYLEKQIRFGISCEMSAEQTIHINCQALIALKKNKKRDLKKKKTQKKNKKKQSSAAIVISILRVNAIWSKYTTTSL